MHCRLYTSTRYVTGAGKLLLHSTSAEAGRLVATQCDDHSVRNCALKAAYTNSVCHSSRQVVASQHRSGAGKLVATQCDGHWAQTLCTQGCTHQLGMSLQQASCRYTAKVLEQANFSLHNLMAIRPRLVHSRLHTPTRYVTGAGKLSLHSTSAGAGRFVATQCDGH